MWGRRAGGGVDMAGSSRRTLPGPVMVRRRGLPSADVDEARRGQAEAAWRALVDGAFRRRWRRTSVREGPWPGAGRAPLWHLSQVLHAAADLVAVGVLDRPQLDEV